MSQEPTTKSRKAPLYQCEECGERLYMTLIGDIVCFNCESPTQYVTKMDKEDNEQAPEKKLESGENNSVAAASLVEHTVDLRVKRGENK